MTLRACLPVLVVGMAACGSGDTQPPERVATVVVDTPKGDLQITLIAPTTALPVPSDPAETTTVGESPHSQTTTGEADPEPPSVRLVEPARLEAAPEVWGGYDRERFPHWSDLDSRRLPHPPRKCCWGAPPSKPSCTRSGAAGW